MSARIKGRGCHDALKAARGNVEAGYRWVVSMDLDKFFDQVNHDVLIARRINNMKKFRNPWEEEGKVIRRIESDGEKKVGVISSTPEGLGWCGSEETKEEKENKNK